MTIFSPFAPAYGRPLDPTSAIIDKNVITGCCCNNIYNEKAIPGCFHPIVLPSPAICLKIQFLAIYPHLRLLMGNPLTPPPLLLTKMLSLDAAAIIYMEKRESRLFLPLCSAISHHLPEKSIFGHLPPFAPAYGQPLDPTSAFIDKNVITGCCCNSIYGEKAIPGCFHPIVPPSPAICLKNQFLAIYPHLRLLMGDPLTPPPLLLTKMLTLYAVTMIYTERKLFQAVSTRLSCHLPPSA